MMRDGKNKSAWLLLSLSIVQMATWVTAASGRPFSYGSQAQTPQPFQGIWAAKENLDGRREMEGNVLADGVVYGINGLGSRPPSCQVKCGGCKPCVAVQVPTPKIHVGVQQQYTNYEPEGWKCRCGSVFFNP